MKKSKYSIIVYILTLMLILPPLFSLAILSFSGRRPWPAILPESYTFRAFREICAPHKNIARVLLSSIALSAVASLAAVLLAAMTARALAFRQFKGKGFFHFVGILPLLIPSTVLAMGFHNILLKTGLADSFAGVAFIHMITALPYALSILSDLFAAIGPRFEEQAAVLGASPLQAFIYVFLPLASPGIFSALAMSFIISYSQYFTTLLAGGGKIKTLSMLMVPYIESGDRALASVYALLFVFSALAVFVFFEFIAEKIFKNLNGKGSSFEKSFD